jgi:hypothetical protein
VIRNHQCTNVTDAGLEKLVVGCPNLTHKNVTGAGLEKVAAGCPNLASLILANWENVNDATLEKLVTGCPNLTSLDLGGCMSVTEWGCLRVIQRVHARAM